MQSEECLLCQSGAPPRPEEVTYPATHPPGGVVSSFSVASLAAETPCLKHPSKVSMAAWISQGTRGCGGLTRACWATALSSRLGLGLGITATASSATGPPPLLQLQARRQVMVEVRDNNVEVALRRLKRKLKEDGSINLLRDQQYHVKPAEQRVLDRKARDLRVSKKEFRYKLRWIMDRRSRGF